MQAVEKNSARLADQNLEPELKSRFLIANAIKREIYIIKKERSWKMAVYSWGKFSWGKF